MFISGIADEAAKDIERQIEAHRELGWKHIELRNIGGVNVDDLPPEEFERVARLLDQAGLRASCLASQIANWSRPITSDLEKDLSELRRAVPRMRRLGAPFLRVMSYPNAMPPWPEARWREEAIRRLRIITAEAERAGVTLVHENCSGWGGLAPERTVDLLSEVRSSALKLVFDTGNPAQYGQDSWAYYQAVKEHIAYVHVKDYLPPAEPGPPRPGTERACFAGDGVGHVRRILKDLLDRGYDGGFSIEPHINSVIHLHREIQDPDLAYRTYLEYGRKFEALLREVKATG